MKLIEFKSGERKQRLDQLLQNYFSKFLKDSSFEKFKKEHIVYVSDRRIRGLDYSVKPRAKIVFVLKEGEFEPPEVVFENKQLVVLDKVIGQPTQGTLKKHEDNLYDQVRLHYLLEKNFPAGLPYVGLHHRLDRDTSGLVLMTKQRSANKDVSELFQNRKISKTYWAFCEKPENDLKMEWSYKCLIERGISKRHPFIFKVGEKGDEAITDFKLMDSAEKYIWLKCQPKTGRTHQIRVQLREQGMPILGDRVYGRKATAQRLMLHAHSLEFNFSGENLKVKSSLDKESFEKMIVIDKI